MAGQSTSPPHASARSVRPLIGGLHLSGGIPGGRQPPMPFRFGSFMVSDNYISLGNVVDVEDRRKAAASRWIKFIVGSMA
jgi:hypothetical protein